MHIVALGFASLPMLLGLFTASLPIIIHLLSRRKYRETEWAAMQWLLAALKKRARRVRLEQLLLLSIRTLLIVCVVLAMSRPFLEGPGTLILSGGRTHHVLVVDVSYSMQFQDGGLSRFDRAKEVTLAILKDCRPGDSASLVTLADPPQALVGTASVNLDAVEREVENMVPQQGGADLNATLALIDEILSTSGQSPTEVYVISDLQTRTWRRSPTAYEHLGEAGWTVVDLGAESDNLAVVALDAEQLPATTGKAIPFRVVIENFGRVDRPDQVVTLESNAAVLDRQVISIPAGGRSELKMSAAFVTPGGHLVRAHMESDPLGIDNHRWYSIDVREALRVLLVDGDPASIAFESETDYLRAALLEENPDRSRPALQLETVTESQFQELSLADFDGVVFANVGQFTQRDAERIENYLRMGGAVIWFLGDQVQPNNYNQLLFRDGGGCFPAKLLGIAGDATQRDSPIAFDPLEYRHPIVAPFQGAVDGGLITTKNFQYFRGEVRDEPDTKVALGFDNLDPAIITSSFGQGSIVVVTTTADLAWTNWPISYSYVPVILELVRHSLRQSVVPRNVTMPDPIRIYVEPSSKEMPLRVVRPDGSSFRRSVAPGQIARSYLLENTAQNGGYVVEIGSSGSTQQTFAVNLNPLESNLSKTATEDIKGILPDPRYLTNWLEIAQGTTTLGRTSGSVHRHLLGMALFLLFLESLLAWRFNR